VSTTVLLILIVVLLGAVAVLLWSRAGAGARRGITASSPSPPPAGAPIEESDAVTPRRVEDLPLGAFVKFAPPGDPAIHELQVAGKLTLARVTTEADIQALSGRLEDWLAAYDDTGQRATALVLQDRTADFSMLVELPGGGWGYFPRVDDVAGEDADHLRDIGGAPDPAFIWDRHPWRRTVDATFKVQAQGASRVDDGTLLRVFEAESTDRSQRFLFLDQWSGQDLVVIGTPVALENVVTEIM